MLFNAFAGSDVTIGEGADQERYTIMLEEDILAILVTPPAKDPFEAAAESVGTGRGKGRK